MEPHSTSAAEPVGAGGDAPRRAVLVVPGDDLHKVEKALRSPADEVVIDLEDAVAPARKDAAREKLGSELCLLVNNLDAPSPAIAVRVNAVGTQWCHRDIEMCASTPSVRSVVVPKVDHPDDLTFVDRLLDGIESSGRTPGGTRVQALVETAAGVSNAARTCLGSRRLASVVIGYADLAVSLGRTSVGSPERWTTVRDAVLVAARAAGVAVIDGPYLGVDDGEDFRASVDAAVDGGLDGKWAIHPRQVPALLEAFQPAPEQVEWAEAVVAALAEAEEAGLGAVALDGEMLDEAIGARARMVLARAGGRS